MPAPFQHSSARSANSNPLDAARNHYQYNYTRIPPIAMADDLPDVEEFSRDWYRFLVEHIRVVFINTLITNRGNRGTQSVRDDVKFFIYEAVLKGAVPLQASILNRLLQVLPQLLLKGVSRDFHELDDLLFSLLRESGLSIFRDALDGIQALLYEGQPTGHVSSVKDYERLVPQMPLPPIAQTYQSDEVFAYMRVAGFNPLVIERVSNPGDRFPVTEAHYQAVMGSEDSLSAAGQEGRLYLADYALLDGAIPGTFPHEQKYVYAPLALFAVPPGTEPNRMLRPIAIQAGQNPREHSIITPQSGHYAWLFAKTIVQIADATLHEPVAHLARTHLFVGSFILPTHHQLLPSHPLSLLLRPHFEGTLAINDAAQRVLIARGGGVDRLTGATIDNSRVLAVKGLQSYRFDTAMLPIQLQQRGVDDPNLLPVYPYRDDALLVWTAIRDWVSDYLHLYYLDDAAVQADAALQAWAAEAQAYDGGRVIGFGQAGGIQTCNYLVDAITLIIFTASAQHAAVNFPQKDLMTYVPALPLAGYMPASTLQGDVSEQDYLQLLPPLDQAQRQLNLLYLLGSMYYNTLGTYPQNHFTDARVTPLLRSFQTKLNQIEATIQQRNHDRPPYEYLLPSRIPQSINI
jgi:arachidonate 15-lipoxygenase